MITIFALPKAFKGHTGVIQNNAIQSWTRLRPLCEIILFGDDEGTAEVADKLGLRHVPDVERNEYGTPLVSSLFGRAQQVAGQEIIGYVNADIILLGNFLEAIRQVQGQRFLIIGRRWDLEVNELLDFDNPDWEKELRSRLTDSGRLHGRSGLDYFVFPRGAYSDIPPFAIGRTSWDNWLIYRARSMGLPVIDASRMATIVHQNHDYVRFQTGEGSARGERKGLEGQRNRELLGSKYHSFNSWDATHFLTPVGPEPTKGVIYRLFRIFRLPEMRPDLTPFVGIIKGLRTIAYRTVVLRRLYTKLLH